MELLTFLEDDVEILEMIGEGASGTVYRAKWKSQGDRLVAVKEFKDWFSSTSAEEQYKLASFIDQIRRHHTKSTQCKHIVPMLGYYLREVRKGQIVKIEVSAVMEMSALHDGKPLTLHNVLQQSNDIPTVVTDDLLRYCEEICKALDVLHVAPPLPEDCPGGGSVVHRDIKPNNILLMNRSAVEDGGGYYAALCDFGLARDVRTTQRSMTGGVGTLDYMAPEVKAGGQHTWQSDIYSFGKILEQCAKIVHPRTVSESLSAVVRQCLDVTASNRPTARKILQHIKTLNAEVLENEVAPRNTQPKAELVEDQRLDEINKAFATLRLKEHKTPTRTTTLHRDPPTASKTHTHNEHHFTPQQHSRAQPEYSFGPPTEMRPRQPVFGNPNVTQTISTNPPSYSEIDMKAGYGAQVQEKLGNKISYPQSPLAGDVQEGRSTEPILQKKPLSGSEIISQLRQQGMSDKEISMKAGYSGHNGPRDVQAMLDGKGTKPDRLEKLGNSKASHFDVSQPISNNHTSFEGYPGKGAKDASEIICQLRQQGMSNKEISMKAGYSGRNGSRDVQAMLDGRSTKAAGKLMQGLY